MIGIPFLYSNEESPPVGPEHGSLAGESKVTERIADLLSEDVRENNGLVGGSGGRQFVKNGLASIQILNFYRHKKLRIRRWVWILNISRRQYQESLNY